MRTDQLFETPQVTTIEDLLIYIHEISCWNSLEEEGFCKLRLSVLQTPYIKLDRTHGVVL